MMTAAKNIKTLIAVGSDDGNGERIHMWASLFGIL
jgi:hypothetical protein